MPYPLIACATDRSLFPQGLPANTHPVLVSIGIQHDIRMAQLEIDDLTSSQIRVPCVDRLRDGRTRFQFPIGDLVGGANGMDLMSYVPSLVGSLENVPINPGRIFPDYQAYHPIAPGLFSAQAKQMVAPNSVSGPGVVPAVADLEFGGTTAPGGYTAHTFHALVNQVTISTTLGGLLCFRNLNYFNETDTGGTLRTGRATLYPVTGLVPASFAGRYANVGGYSANSQNLGFMVQDCVSAAAQNDLSASV